MSQTSTSTSPPAVRRHRFTVVDFYRMAEAGILAEDDRVELLDGEIIEMTPIGPRHASCVDRIAETFLKVFGDRAIVRVQNPLRLDERSEPEPDVALVRRRADRYREAHPTPKDVFVLVEIGESSRTQDRQLKLPLYAVAGVPEVWLVDLSTATVTVHREPIGSTYTQVTTHRSDERIASAAFADDIIDLQNLLA